MRIELADLGVGEAAVGPAVDGQVVQLAHLPAGHVLHQTRLLVTVAAQLLQVSAEGTWKAGVANDAIAALGRVQQAVIIRTMRCRAYELNT